jgi:hypothetical protein
MKITIKIKKRKPTGGFLLDINGKEYLTVSRKSYDKIVGIDATLKLVRQSLKDAVALCDKE